MFSRLLIGLVIVIALFAAVVAMQPNEFRVERSAVINAPAEAIFVQINNLHKWESWSPWAKIDPNATMSYSGAEEGAGASFSWDGNRDVGKGTMTITESLPSDRIQFQLDFDKPYKSSAVSEFVLKSAEDGTTNVTWSMHGNRDFISKAVGLFMNCEKMVGEKYEEGLTNLADVVHNASAAPLPSDAVEQQSTEGTESTEEAQPAAPAEETQQPATEAPEAGEGE